MVWLASISNKLPSARCFSLHGARPWVQLAVHKCICHELYSSNAHTEQTMVDLVFGENKMFIGFGRRVSSFRQRIVPILSIASLIYHNYKRQFAFRPMNTNKTMWNLAGVKCWNGWRENRIIYFHWIRSIFYYFPFITETHWRRTNFQRSRMRTMFIWLNLMESKIKFIALILLSRSLLHYRLMFIPFAPFRLVSATHM